MNLKISFNQSHSQAYVNHLKSTNLSDASIKRKLSSLSAFQKFLIKKGHISERQSRNSGTIRSQPKLKQFVRQINPFSFNRYVIIAILLIMLSGLGYGLYSQTILKAKRQLAYTTAANLQTPNRFLSFQGRLTDSSDNPISSSTGITFKLFNSGTGGTELYASGIGNSQAVTPDSDGIFNVIIGKTHGTEIPASVFSESVEVWLEITTDSETMDPRQQIATVAYALNSETLQGLPPSSTGMADTVMVLDASGNINLGETSPSIVSSSGILGIEGQAMLLKATDGSGGNIEINPDAAGIIKLTTEGAGSTAVGGFVDLTNANLATGNLINAQIGNDSMGYNFLEFQNFAVGTTGYTTRFSIGASGDVTISDSLSVGTTLTTANLSIGNTLITASATELNLLDGTLATNGSILYGDGSNLTNLNAGTSGYVLQTNGAGQAPIWVDSAGVGSSNTYTAGVGISFSAANEFAFASHELTDLTWGTGSPFTWTFDTGATDPSLYVKDEVFAFQNANVGIGTTGPSTKLQVYGGISNGLNEVLRVSGGAAALESGPSIGFHDRYGGDAYPTWKLAEIGAVYSTGNYGGDLVFYTNWPNSPTDLYENMRLTAAGNLGIGTSSPGYKLEVSGSGLFTTLGVGATSASYDFYVTNNAGVGKTLNTTTLSLGGSVVTSTATEINYLDGSTVTDGGIIYGDGTKFANTGVGNSGEYLMSDGTNPPVWNSITGDNYVQWFAADGDGSTYPVTSADTLTFVEGTGIDVDFTGDDQLTITNVGVTNTYDAGSGLTLSGSTFRLGGALSEDARLNIGSTEVMFWDYSTGNVGIGTTGPVGKLDIVPNYAINFRPATASNPSTGYYGGVRWDTYSGETMIFATKSTGTKMMFAIGHDITTSQNSQEQLPSGPELTIMNNNVGIGTTAPKYKLEVAGSGLFTTLGVGATSASYDFYVTNSAGIGKTLNTSTLSLGGSVVTSTAGEINYLDGSAVTDGGIIYGDGTKFANTGVGSSGEYLMSDGTNPPVWNSITGDNYVQWFAADGDGSTYPVTSADTLTFVEGTGIDVNFTGDDQLTITNVGVTNTYTAGVGISFSSTNEFAFASHELTDLTWGTGSPFTWTFDTGATDPSLYVKDEVFAFQNARVGIGTTNPTGPLEIETGTTSGTAVTIDQNDIDQTALDIDIINTEGSIINIDWDTATQGTSGTSLVGIDLDFGNFTPVDFYMDTMYGVLVQSPTANNASDSYGIRVAGTNWDYGIQSDDDAYFAGIVYLGDTNTLVESDGDVMVGGTSETLSNAGFTMDGNDIYIAGLAGIKGNVYTDGSFIAGASLTLSDTGIIDSNSDMNFTSNTDGFNFSLGGGAGDDFIVNGTTLIVESDNNRIGIGTTAPKYKLEVNGSGLFTTLGVGATSASYDFYVTNSAGIGKTLNTTTLSLAGSVVTSTATEINYLDGSAVTDGGIIYGDGTKFANTGVGSSGEYLMSDGTNPPVWNSISGGTTYYAGSGLTLDVGSSFSLGGALTQDARLNIGSTEVMFWDYSTGNVGIGTTGPGAKLEIKDTSDSVNLFKTVSSGNSSFMNEWGQLSLSAFGDASMDYGSALEVYHGDASEPVMSIKGGSTGDFLRIYDGTTQVFTVKDGGNVGIGTTGPYQALHIYGGASGVASAYSNSDLVVEGGAETAIQFLGTTSSVQHILFGDGTGAAAYRGQISYSHADDTLYFLAGAARIMNIKGGNVGIGTTGPGEKLSIENATAKLSIKSTTGTNFAYSKLINTGGTLYFGLERSTGGALLTGSSAYAGVINHTGNYPIQLGTNGAIRLTVANTGNVGIGTTGPKAKLHVAGGYFGVTKEAADSHFYLGDEGTITGQDEGLDLWYDFSEGNTYFDGLYNGDIYFRTAVHTTPINALTILNTGNVGIGTTEPGYSLDVSGTLSTTDNAYFGEDPASAIDGIAVAGTYTAATASGGGGNLYVYTNDGLGADKGGVISFGGDYATSGVETRWAAIAGLKDNATTAQYGGYMALYTRTHGSLPAERMRIDSNGNVGIGTTAPDEKLDVIGDFQLSGVVQVGGASSGLAYHQFGTGTKDEANIADAQDVYISDDLEVDGTIYGDGSGITGVTASPAGSDGEIQYNNGGTMGGATILHWDDGNSRLGIGTTGPNGILEIADSSGPGAVFRITDTGNIATAGDEYGRIEFFTSDGSAYGNDVMAKIRAVSEAVNDNYGNLSFQVRTTGDAGDTPAWKDAIYIQHTGNVGIGTTGPSEALDVVGRIRASQSIDVSGLSNPSGGPTINLAYDTGSDWGAVRARDWDGASWKPINFQGSGFYFSTGNVGIGTTGPGGKLEINTATTGGATALILRTNNFSAANSTIRWQDNAGNNEAAIGSYYNVADAGALEFLNGATTNMIIRSTGNVGIGTTGPKRPLHVATTSGFPTLGTSNGQLLLSGTDGLWGMYLGGDNATGVGWIQQMRNDSATAYNLLLQPVGGNVGIGTTGPAYDLDVATIARARSKFTAKGTGSRGSVSAAEGNDTLTGYFEWRLPAVDGAAGTRLGYMGWSTADVILNLENSADFAVMSGDVGIGTATPHEKLSVANGWLKAQADGYGVKFGALDGSAYNLIRGYSAEYEAGLAFGTRYPLVYQTLTSGAHEFVDGGGNSLFAVTGSAASSKAYFAGNVGIGTTNPGEKLHVYSGEVIIEDTNGTTDLITLRNISNNDQALYIGMGGQASAAQAKIAGQYGLDIRSVYDHAAYYIDFATANTERMRITNAGNVGIGTTSPQAKLDIEEQKNISYPTPGTTTGNIHLNPSGSNPTYSTAITFGAGDASSGNTAQAGIYTQYSGGFGTKMYFGTTNSYATGSQIRMMIDHAGNVGIGTTDPGAELEVNGDIMAQKYIDVDNVDSRYYLDPANSALTVSSLALAHSGSIHFNAYYSSGWKRIVSSSAAKIQNFTNGLMLGSASSAGIGTTITDWESQSLFIDTSGQVGIGTTSPASLLEVRKDQNAETALKVRNLYTGAGGVVKLSVGYSDSAALDIFRNYGDNNIYYNGTQASTDHRFQTAGADLVTFKSGGNVGIGTIGPTAPLVVKGAGSANGYSGVLRIFNTSADGWSNITLASTETGTGATDNFYIIGRGSSIADREMSFHIPRDNDYGDSTQPKFRFASSGADTLMTLEAETGNAYIKGNVDVDGTLYFDAANADGHIDMDNFRIQDLGDPDSGDDAMDRDYADARYINTSGDTMTGRLGQDDLGFMVATKDDISTRTDSGFFQTSTATTAEGWPEAGGWYHLLSSTHSNTGNYYSMQFAADFYNSTDIFYRATAGSGATAWNKLWHAGNDGSGTGLDADTLDTISSGSFLRSDADDSFSGGLVSTARDEGIFGTYSSTLTDHIWSMGAAYKNHASGTNFGNLYGLAYKHTNNPTGGTMAGGHQMVWAQNGTGTAAMGTNIWTSGSITAGSSGYEVQASSGNLDLYAPNHYIATKSNNASYKWYWYNASAYKMSLDNNGALKTASTMTASTAPDIAENIDAPENATAGDILSANPNQTESTILSAQPYDPTLIGVISTDPGILIAANLDGNLNDIITNDEPLVLAGRIPTKVSDINGEIKIGDAITSSHIPGVGMKATKAGPIVSKALQDFSTAEKYPCPAPNQNSQCAKILTFVTASWYDPDIYLTDTGEINIIGTDNNYTLKDKDNNPITRIGTFAEIITAQIKTGLLTATDIITENITSKTSISENLKTNTISPLSDLDSSITIDADVEITGSTILNNITAATLQTGIIDTDLLQAQDIQTTSLQTQDITTDNLETKDATVTGTLYANNIISNHGSFTEIMADKIASLRSEIRKLINTPTTPSGDITGSSLLAQASEWTTLLATDSARIEGDLSIGHNLVIAGQLLIEGQTQLADAFVTGTLTAGQIAIRDNYIETTADALYIQPSGIGSIHLLSDTMIISDTGSVTVNGDLVVNGSLTASTGQFNSLASQNFNTHTATVSASLFANLLSTIEASVSGTLTADKINANSFSVATASATIIAESGPNPPATASAQIASNATAGTVTLPGGKTEITVFTDHISTDSMVYLTPAGSTQNQVAYIKNKFVSPTPTPPGDTPTSYFTIALDQPLNNNLDINWWIIN